MNFIMILNNDGKFWVEKKNYLPFQTNYGKNLINQFKCFFAGDLSIYRITVSCRLPHNNRL
jgi:hypothetical protein